MKLTRFTKPLDTDKEKLAARSRTRHLRRFHTCYQKADSGCWLWTKQRYKSGQPRFNAGTHGMLAHELSYSLSTGKTLFNETIEQTCGNKLCVNRAHLKPSGKPKFYDCGRMVTEPKAKEA